MKCSVTVWVTCNLLVVYCYACTGSIEQEVEEKLLESNEELSLADEQVETSKSEEIMKAKW